MFSHKLMYKIKFEIHKLKIQFVELDFSKLFFQKSSTAEKKMTAVTSWATDKMTTIFTQNDNFDHFEWSSWHFVYLLSL